MFKASRQVSTILRAGQPLASALSNGFESQVVEAARALASVAAQIGAELTAERSKALIARNRAYEDQAADYLMECCEGIVASARALEQSTRRDAATYALALHMLTSYFDLVGDATSAGGASPHAMLGGPPQFVPLDPFYDVPVQGRAQPSPGLHGEFVNFGQDERVARGRALAAKARAEKARLQGNAKPAAAPPVRYVSPPSVRICHISVEATGEYDLALYSALIARGSSEIVARASAKAHFIREKKRRIVEGGS